MDVMGFEPTASTLRMWSSGPFDRVFTPIVQVENLRFLRSPHDPSPSLSIRSRKVTPPTPTACQVDFHVAPSDLVANSQSRAALRPQRAQACS